jgi:hypothetical protein
LNLLANRAVFRAFEADDAGGGAPPAENSAIRQLRSHAESLEAQLKEATAKLNETTQKLTERERAEMDELNRTKAEKDDLAKKVSELEPLRDEVGRYASKFEGLYKETLNSIPEEHRERLERRTNSGTWADRYEALLDLKGLIPEKVAPKGGTSTNPTHPGPVTPPATNPQGPATSPKDWGNIDLGRTLLETMPEGGIKLPANTTMGRPAMAGIPDSDE